MRLVVGPAGAHLDPELEEHLGVEQLLELLARLGADALQALAACRRSPWPCARRARRRWWRRCGAALPSSSNLSITTVRGVGQLVAGQAEQLLAHDLAGEEALAAVGERVLVVAARAARAGTARRCRAGARRRLARSWPTAARTRRRHGAPACDCSHGASVGAAVHLVELVGHQQRRLAGRQQRQHLARRPAPKRPASTTNSTTSTSASAPRHRPVQGAVQRARRAGSGSPACRRRRTARARGADAGDAVARGLRLARGDADLLADQRVEQRRLADVGPADDGDQAAALRRSAPLERLALGGMAQSGSQRAARLVAVAFSASSMRRAASCSAARRERALAALASGSAPAPRTRPRRSARAPGRGGDDAVDRAPACWRACSHSCSSVLASLAQRADVGGRR